MAASSADLDRRLARVQLLLLDVDGVLTDGRITLDGRHAEPKTFHVHDGLAIRQWIARGGRVAVVTGRRSPAVLQRAEELGIDPVVQGAGDKAAALARVLAETGIDSDYINEQWTAINHETIPPEAARHWMIRREEIGLSVGHGEWPQWSEAAVSAAE